MKVTKSILALLLVLLVAANVWQCSGEPEVIIKETTDTVRIESVRLDTFYIERDPVIRTIEKPVVVYRQAPIAPQEDSVSIYRDTTFTTNYDIFYTASVTGRLNQIDLGVIDRRPEVVKTVTKKVTITNTKEIVRPQNGLFLTGSIVIPSVVSNQFSMEVGATLLRRKVLYSYGYDIVNGGHRAGIGLKIF